jgi:hypothetical protein
MDFAESIWFAIYGGNPHRILFFWHSVGNRFINHQSFYNLNLTDVETCFKLFKHVNSIDSIKRKTIWFLTEITAKIALNTKCKNLRGCVSLGGRT